MRHIKQIDAHSEADKKVSKMPKCSIAHNGSRYFLGMEWAELEWRDVYTIFIIVTNELLGKNSELKKKCENYLFKVLINFDSREN